MGTIPFYYSGTPGGSNLTAFSYVTGSNTDVCEHRGWQLLVGDQTARLGLILTELIERRNMGENRWRRTCNESTHSLQNVTPMLWPEKLIRTISTGGTKGITCPDNSSICRRRP